MYIHKCSILVSFVPCPDLSMNSSLLYATTSSGAAAGLGGTLKLVQRCSPQQILSKSSDSPQTAIILKHKNDK